MGKKSKAVEEALKSIEKNLNDPNTTDPKVIQNSVAKASRLLKRLKE